MASHDCYTLLLCLILHSRSGWLFYPAICAKMFFVAQPELLIYLMDEYVLCLHLPVMYSPPFLVCWRCSILLDWHKISPRCCLRRRRRPAVVVLPPSLLHVFPAPAHSCWYPLALSLLQLIPACVCAVWQLLLRFVSYRAPPGFVLLEKRRRQHWPKKREEFCHLTSSGYKLISIRNRNKYKVILLLPF